ncbi:ribosomal protein S18-alanine N-acetyltransferase [Lyngbya sp. CCY1209]|uniref:ribosomal protein S18-alanine N-acetyltransferase n=1 Tax=Lyngbya sp. CCY1209 TaxID=2886103 RepID=UPI002D20E7FB|nr:ribosomal protein S18-alanine N-acetyltransferase [Lyngbya sp. CCY1209]MEB3882103.1 ribosomal protein S18-alanine N-acetyltransferase [Lyngbya sp. CCY1209]
MSGLHLRSYQISDQMLMPNGGIVTGLELKFLTPELLGEVAELDHLCLGGLWTLEGYRRELESPNSDILVWTSQPGGETFEGIPSPRVAISDPPPVVGMGCLWAILDEAHITLLAVHPDYRKLGLGKTLLRALLESARRRGLARATLEVRASNAIAIALYERFGFQVAGTRRGYYADTGEDALILWLGGLQSAEFREFLRDRSRESGSLP